MLKALQKRAQAVLCWSLCWITPKACCPGTAAGVIRSRPDELQLKDPFHATTTLWRERYGAAAIAGLLVALLDAGNIPFCSDQTKEQPLY